MRDRNRRRRHAQITDAAYALLEERGYGGTSMLGVAKAARASNETMYRWYGDKQGLFAAMVRDNADRTRRILEGALESGGDPMATLEGMAPVLLEMLLGDRAVLLNRAAAADATGELGSAISAGGRATILPLVTGLMRRIGGGDTLRAEELTELYMSLLIGDLQIKRVIGVMDRPTEAEIARRAAGAYRAFLRLLPDEVDTAV